MKHVIKDVGVQSGGGLHVNYCMWNSTTIHVVIPVPPTSMREEALKSMKSPVLQATLTLS